MSGVSLFAPVAHATTEVVVFAYHDAAGELSGMRHIPSSRFASADTPVRTVILDVLAFNAQTVTMAHNHPSGDPEPSLQDMRVTRRIVVALDALGVRLVDHLVLAGDTVISFRASGLL